MNKRGQGLPMNTIIIAIIVIVVLIAIVIFFLGGFRNIASSISSIWSQQVSSTPEALARETCQSYCTATKSMASDTEKKGSNFCRQKFNIDKNNDGVLKDAEKGISCETLTSCPGVVCPD